MIDKADKVKWLSEFTGLCREIAALEDTSANIQSQVFERAISDRLEECERIAAAIENIQDVTLREVLLNRYVEGRAWEKVALAAEQCVGTAGNYKIKCPALLMRGWGATLLFGPPQLLHS